MFKGMSLQKAALLLALIFVATAAIAGVIFFAQYGFDFNSETMFSGDIKGGVKVDEEKTEALQGLDTISVQTVSDNINIIPVDTNEVKAHFYGSYISSNKDMKPEFTVVRSGDKLDIKVRYTHNFMAISFRSNLKLDVYVPRQYAGNLETVSTSGEIAADGLTLEGFTSKTTSGNLDAKRINAKVAKIGTTSGETKINGTYESFTFKSTSGDLVSTELNSKSAILGSTSGEIIVVGTLGDVKAKTVSGNIELEYSSYSNKVDVETTSGEVTIKLPESAGFAIDFNSTSGNADCDFPITVSGSRDGHRLVGTVGNGEGNIKVTTTSGELRIKK